jgi:hypothetical protein
MQSLPGHLHELASCLRNLSSRVRESVAEAVSITVGRAVQDGLTRLLEVTRTNAPPKFRQEPEIDPYDWSAPNSENSWDQDEPIRAASYYARQQEPEPAPQKASAPAPYLVALGLKMTAWWLRRRGSWAGALGLGLLVSGLAMAGGPIAVASLGFAEAASEVIALNNLLSTSADALSTA